MIEVLEDSRLVESWLPEVLRWAESDRDALGWLPNTAYSEAIYKGQLFVATEKANAGVKYAGHIFFGGRFPQLQIRQLFVRPDLRGRGIGKLLMSKLTKFGEDNGYLSIKARVATDLMESLKVYGKFGFTQFNEVPGGTSRGRTIAVIGKKLKTPSLFNWQEINASNGVGGFYFPIITNSSPPIYLLDLNVVLDAVRSRTGSDEARRLIGACLASSFSLYFSEELIVELERHTSKFSNDPLLELSRQIDVLDAPEKKDQEKYTKVLAPLIFPERYKRNKLSERDISDVRHISTAIAHGLTGFITREKAILRAAAKIRELYGLDVATPRDLVSVQNSSDADVRPTDAISPNSAVGLKSISLINDPLLLEIENNIASPMRNRNLVGYNAFVLTRNSQPIGYVSWQKNLLFGTTVLPEVHLLDIGDEQEVFADFLIDFLLRNTAKNWPTAIRISQDNLDISVRIAALKRGFRSVDTDNNILEKICIGKVLTTKNWDTATVQVSKITGIKLRLNYATEDVDHVQISSTHNEETHHSLLVGEFEKIFSPVILLSKSKSAVLVPIERQFSDILLGTTKQLSLFGINKTQLLSTRTYVSTIRSYSQFEIGSSLIFYESSSGGGRMAATAVCRVTALRRGKIGKITQKDLQKTVIDETTASKYWKRKGVCFIDFTDVFYFKNPVPFDRLKEIGCIDRSNLITSRKITHSMAEAIIAEGDPRVSP